MKGLLDAADSAALINKIDAWCDRTGTNYNRLVIAAKVGVSTRSNVRTKGQRISLKVAARLEDAMSDNPKGISREEHTDRLRAEVVIFPNAVEQQRIESAICPRCGSRDYECGHRAVPGGFLRVRC